MTYVNYTTRWLYQHLAGQSVPTGSAVCAMCGLLAAASTMTPKAKVFRPTFVDYDLQARPEATELCQACVWYFDHQELLRSHWYLSATSAIPLAKTDLLPLFAKHLADPPNEDHYYLITFTQRKHVALRGQLNAAGSHMLRVNAETFLVNVDHRFMKLVDNLSALRVYHSWAEIEADNYLPYAILRWPSLTEFAHHRMAVTPWLRSPHYYLARYLYMPKEKEKNDEQFELLE